MFQKKNYLLLFLLILVTFGCDSDDDTNFLANLDGSSEVPPVTTSATGSANFTLDEDNDTIQFTLNVSNISNVIMAHIHSGAVGVNGGIVVLLFGGPQTGPVNGVLSSGTIRSQDVQGMSFQQLVTAMRSGQTYVNVHTTQNPNGEIRGQIILN